MYIYHLDGILYCVRLQCIIVARLPEKGKWKILKYKRVSVCVCVLASGTNATMIIIINTIILLFDGGGKNAFTILGFSLVLSCHMAGAS